MQAKERPALKIDQLRAGGYELFTSDLFELNRRINEFAGAFLEYDSPDDVEIFYDKATKDIYFFTDAAFIIMRAMDPEKGKLKRYECYPLRSIDSWDVEVDRFNISEMVPESGQASVGIRFTIDNRQISIAASGDSTEYLMSAFIKKILPNLG
jgi:hypothetical protein